MHQVWYTQNIEPHLTQEQQLTFCSVIKSQTVQVGKEKEGRQLVRGLIDVKYLQKGIDYLNALEKEVIICDVRSQTGLRCGYVKVFQPVQTTEMVSTEEYTIERATVLHLDGSKTLSLRFPTNTSEYNRHVNPTKTTNEDGASVEEPPTPNTASGWATWEERL